MSGARFAHIEFDAADCDPGVVAASIRTSGCALIRRAMPESTMGYLNDVLPFVFRYLDLRETYAYTPPKPVHLPLIRLDMMPVLSEAMGFDVNGRLLAGFEHSILPQVRDGYFRGRATAIHPQMCVARRQNPTEDENSLPFHQDGTNYSDMDFLNFWIPATPAGGDAPGLEVVPRALQASLAVTQQESLHPLIELEETAIVNQFGADSLYHPEMQPGDVIIMNQFTIHRTHTPPGARNPRFSLELRILAS